jgi:hypothetical protein
MMVKSVYILVIFCLAALLLLPGCKGKDEDEIVCPMLYQKSGSFADALKFIEMPEDKMETSLSVLKQKWELADRRQLAFANKLFSLRKNKDFDLFKSLLSEGTKGQLDKDNNKSVVHQYKRQINEGTFIYGQNDAKFFATFREFTEAESEKLKKHVSFADAPTHVLHYWHRHKPGSMLIGSSFYLVQDKGSYKLVTETLLKGELTLEPKQPAPSSGETLRRVALREEPEKGVFVSFQQVADAYTKEKTWKYRWKIEFGPVETAANRFEMLKLSEIISVQGHADIHPDIARQVLISQDMFSKYKDELLRLKFYIGDKEPVVNVAKYDRQVTGWDFGYSMVNLSKSGFMYFLGKEILNVDINKDVKFVGSNLELLSFETEKDSVGYKNRIVLSKTPIEPKSAEGLPQPEEFPVKPEE